MKRSGLAGDALAEDAGGFVDQNAHCVLDFRFQISNIRFGISDCVLQICNLKSEI
jgi:hypothetical protein